MEMSQGELVTQPAATAVEVDKESYIRRLTEFVSDELNPFDREMFSENLADYHSGKVDLMELLNLMESILSLDLLMGFPILINEYEREEAFEYIQTVSDETRALVTAAEANTTKTCEDETPAFVTREDMDKEFKKLQSFYRSRDELLHIEIMKLRANHALIVKDDDGDEEPELYSLLEDAYSFIMVDPFSFASVSTLVTFLLQFSAYFLITYDMAVSFDFNGKNILGVAPGVSEEILLSQAVSLLFLILVQDGLWGAAYIMLDGYDPDLAKEGITHFFWFFGNALRFFEGLFMTLVTFLLVIQKSNVVDLFKDFSAMMFITSMDDVVFLLGERGYLTKGIRDVAEKVTNLRYCSAFTMNEQKENEFRKNIKRMFRAGLILMVLISMYTVWILLGAYPQRQGYFLPDHLYIQLGDEVRPSASRLSGVYRKETNGNFTLKDNRVFYVEKSYERFIVRFCSNLQRWVFVERDDEGEECNEENIKIRSDSAIETQSFDFIEDPLEWEVKSIYNDDQFIPMNFIKILELQSKELNEAPFNYRDIDSVCPSLEIDDRFLTFVGTRTWSKIFDLLTTLDDEGKETMVQVQNRPVFFQEEDSDEYWSDLIIFFGIRWGILSSLDIHSDECDIKDRKKLIECLEMFNGYHSNYTVSFFSDIVKIDSPQDTPSPQDLKWYHPTTNELGRDQSADLTQGSIDATLLCKECNDDETVPNPCFYGNKCISGICDCKNGSRGSLCQVPPTNNGHCDDYFNTPQFNFDNGDCCVDTCESKDLHMCGTDGDIYVGYDNCKFNSFKRDQSQSDEISWKKTDKSVGEEVFTNQIDYTVSTTPNGRTVVIGEPSENKVFIMDQDGSKWKRRGTSIKKSDEILFGREIQVSSPLFSVTTQKYFSPLTIVISSNSSSYVYDWDHVTNGWEDVTPLYISNLVKNDINVEHRVEILDNGHTLLVSSNEEFVILRRANIESFWIEIQRIKKQVQSFTMTDSASELILLYDESIANQTNPIQYFVRRYSIFVEQPLSIKLTGGNMLFTKFSRKGRALGIFTKESLMQQTGDIWIYTKSDNTAQSEFLSFSVPIRDASISTSRNFFLSDDGKFVYFKDSRGNLIKTYHWNGKTWNLLKSGLRKEKDTIHGESFAVTYNFESLVVADSRESQGKISIYRNTREICTEAESLLRYSMSLDERGLEVVSGISILEVKEENMLSNFRAALGKNIQAYSHKNVAISAENCIPETTNQFCHYLLLYDFRGNLDKLVNGTTFFVNGREETFSPFVYLKNGVIITLAGPESCSTSDRESEFLNNGNRITSWVSVDCYEAMGNNVTNQLYGNSSKERFGTQVRVSGDGLVVAIIAAPEISEIEQIKIFKYDQTNKFWVRLGGKMVGIDNKFDVARSLSLSETGQIVAVGIISNTGVGRVQVYKLNEDHNWAKQGAGIVDGNPGSLFGFTISLSSDGSTVAVGAPSHNSVGVVRVFDFATEDSAWKQIGANITDNVTGGLFGRDLDLSFNGTLVAIASINHGVSVYSLKDDSGEWIQYGNSMGNNVLSLSLNIYYGTYQIAFVYPQRYGNGKIFQNVDVYRYVHDNGGSWIRIGQSIKGEYANGKTSMFLSNEVLVVGSQGNIMDPLFDGFGVVKAYIFEEITNSWHLWGTEITGDSRDVMFGDSISGSLNVSTVAVSSPTFDKNGLMDIGSVKIIKFGDLDCDNKIRDKSIANCHNNESLFRFTLSMDVNPQDIDWELAHSDGTTILGERFTQKKDTIKMATFDKRTCIPKDQLVSFFIKDAYGDGLCCDWGKGNFTLLWNDESIISRDASLQFKQLKALCLPQDIPSSMFRIEILFHENPTETHWRMFDGSFGLLSSSERYGATLRNKHFTKSICIPPPSSVCNLVFLTIHNLYFSTEEKKSEYEIFFNDNKVIDKETFGQHSIYRIGSCATCSDQDKSTVQILLTGNSALPKQRITLIDSSNQTLFEDSDENLTRNGMYYREVCVPKNECLTFINEDLSCDGISSQIDIHEIYLDHILMKRVLGNFGCRDILKFGTCKSCPDSNALVQVSAGKENYIGKMNWKITDHSGSIVLEDEYPRKFPDVFDYSEKCVPVEACMKLLVNETAQNNLDLKPAIQLTWNGTVVQMGHEAYDATKGLMFGNCT